MKRLVVLLVMSSALLPAQTVDSTARTAADSVLLRAKGLVKDGREAEGRKAIDSLLKTLTPDSAMWAEVVYWRGALSATAADAERDYRRLLIEAPLSARAEDALLQLANLLQARGDRRGASDYLQRFMLTYANSPARPRVALSLVRLLFDQGPQQQARACEAYRMGRDAIPQESLELRNQLEFYGPRCAMEVAAVPAAPAESTVVTPTTSSHATPAAPTDSAPRPTPAKPATSATSSSAFYSVQIAAYNSREPAQSLASVLVERGIEARVDGTAAPFRVRVGKYKTRSEAVKAAATLKSQGHNGFITLVSGK